MKVFSVILVLCCVISASLAGQALLQDASHPDHPGKCYDEGSKAVLDPEETRSLAEHCMELFCSKSLSLTYTTCGATLPDSNCVEIEQDLTKGYPECCIKYKCQVDGKISYL